jgi:hypothetical protein
MFRSLSRTQLRVSKLQERYANFIKTDKAQRYSNTDRTAKAAPKRHGSPNEELHPKIAKSLRKNAQTEEWVRLGSDGHSTPILAIEKMAEVFIEKYVAEKGHLAQKEFIQIFSTSFEGVGRRDTEFLIRTIAQVDKEIRAERTNYCMIKKLCFTCEQPGHSRNDCPYSGTGDDKKGPSIIALGEDIRRLSHAEMSNMFIMLAPNHGVPYCKSFASEILREKNGAKKRADAKAQAKAQAKIDAAAAKAKTDAEPVARIDEATASKAKAKATAEVETEAQSKAKAKEEAGAKAKSTRQMQSAAITNGGGDIEEGEGTRKESSGMFDGIKL